MAGDADRAGPAVTASGHGLHRCVGAELARMELERTAKSAAADAAVVLLGGIVALIGLGLLCLVAVAALEAVIEPLWLRLLIMSLVYLAIAEYVWVGLVGAAPPIG